MFTLLLCRCHVSVILRRDVFSTHTFASRYFCDCEHMDAKKILGQTYTRFFLPNKCTSRTQIERSNEHLCSLQHLCTLLAMIPQAALESFCVSDLKILLKAGTNRRFDSLHDNTPAAPKVWVLHESIKASIM